MHAPRALAVKVLEVTIAALESSLSPRSQAAQTAFIGGRRTKAAGRRYRLRAATARVSDCPSAE